MLNLDGVQKLSAKDFNPCNDAVARRESFLTSAVIDSKYSDRFHPPRANSAGELEPFNSGAAAPDVRLMTRGYPIACRRKRLRGMI